MTQLETLRATLATLQQRRAALSAGGQVAELTVKLRHLEGEGQAIYNKLRQEAYGQADEAQKVLRAAEFVLAEEERKRERLKQDLANDKFEASRLGTLLVEMRAEYAKIKGKTLDVSRAVKDTCPTCERPLPAEQVAAAEQKAIADFNERKAELLAANQTEGKALKKQCESLEAKINAQLTDLEAWDKNIAELTEQRDAARCATDRGDPVPDTTERTANLEAQEKIRAEIEAAKTDTSGDLESIEEQIATIQAQIRELEQAAAKAAAAEESKARIKELEAEEKKLSAELEEIDQKLWLLDEFTRAKCAMLESTINSKFKLVSWRLFETQINGGIAPVCECRIHGTPGSTGERINAGLEILQVLGEHYGFTPPVWIDGAESVTAPLPTTAQQIRLRVEKGEKKLKMEVAS